MRYSKEHKAHTRQRILEMASTLFRERGIDQVSVNDVMAGTGLTHGGFYAHFTSKDDLVAEAVAQALEQTTERLVGFARRAHGGNGLKTAIRSYLSPQHRDNPGQGCALAALAAEVGRGTPQARHRMTAKLHEMVDALGEFGEGQDAQSREKQILGVLSGMVGALVLARLADDERYANRILQASRDFLENAVKNVAAPEPGAGTPT